MTLLYLDSSAITKLVVEEAGSAELRAELGGWRLVTSRLSVVEVTKAVGRVDPAIDPSAVFDRLSFVELDPELAAMAATVGGPTLRSLDSIHLASAQLLGEELIALMTYDTRQAAAARALGIDVRSPGTRPS